MRIYLAAAVFSMADKLFNSYIKEILEELTNIEVFLPQNISPYNKDGRKDMRHVFLKCKSEIDTSDMIVAVVDGADVDAGVSWELGYAYSQGIPYICIRTDNRKSEDKGVNVMLEYSAKEMCYVKYDASKQEFHEILIRMVEQVRLNLKR